MTVGRQLKFAIVFFMMSLIMGNFSPCAGWFDDRFDTRFSKLAGTGQLETEKHTTETSRIILATPTVKTDSNQTASHENDLPSYEGKQIQTTSKQNQVENDKKEPPMARVKPESATRVENKPSSKADGPEKGMEMATKSVSQYAHQSPPESVKAIGQFVIEQNGVVYDQKTGLEWYIHPDIGTGWYSSKKWASKLKLNGGGWRMPAKEEVAALKETKDMPLIKNSEFQYTWYKESSNTPFNFNATSEHSSWAYTQRLDKLRAMAVRKRN